MFTTVVVGTLLALAAQISAGQTCITPDLPREDIVTGDLGRSAHAFLLTMTDDGFSGAVLISRDGEVVLKKGYGFANLEKRQRNNSETLFNIASVAKIFTAAAILDLEQQRALSLDDRLSKHLGALPGKKSAATIHQLLVHTAGLVARGTKLEYESRQSYVDSIKQAPIDTAPGEAYRYTNAGYILLAAITETISEMPFEAYLAERIFQPACMTKTAFFWEEHIQNHESATGYAGDTVDQLFPESRETIVWGYRGPSNIASNVGDLYRWILAIKDERVLSSSAIEKMFTAYVGDEGYGWHVIDTEHGRLLRRGGGLPEFESSLRWYQDEDLVIVVLINNHLGFRVPIIEGLERIAFEQSSSTAAVPLLESDPV